jgi:hypothetical protein
MLYIVDRPRWGNENSAYADLPLFSWTPAAPTSRHPLHVVADRLSRRLGVPYRVALAHAEAAGLGGHV